MKSKINEWLKTNKQNMSKTKLIMTSLILVLAVTFYSFKALGEKESSGIALVMTFYSKDASGYTVFYGDGTTENIPFKIKYNSGENALETAAISAKIMNVLHDKGYRYTGAYSTPNSGVNAYPFMIFEKK